MNLGRRIAMTVLVVCVCLLARGASAQTTTTGSLSGMVVDQSGGALPGVAVTATHGPTGTKYETVTGSEGRFQIPNVRVGGPYTVTTALSGFKDQTQTDVTVALGEDKTLQFKMTLATLTESITVSAQATVAQAGTAANIPSMQIESLPTIQRSITDIARTNPFFNPTTLGSNGDKALSVAGRHNRYNNLQIDGAVNNDLFGLADSGTPGGPTGTQPISLDAVQEIQLVVSPYDVKQGGFSGGGINIITKSGSNTFAGTGYMFARNQKLIGAIPPIATVASIAANPNPPDLKVGTFTDKQSGFSVGGPIVKNRVFFFDNEDWARKNTPSGYSLDGTSGQQFGPADLDLAKQVLAYIKSTYGFDPGGIGETTKPTNSDKAFLRTDINLSSKNQLTARVNYINALAHIGFPSNFSYLLPDRFYNSADKILSAVGQLNTTVSKSTYNEFRITYQRDRAVRGDQPTFNHFPMVRFDFPDNNNMILGTENSSQANALNQDVVEINDDLTWIKGKHTISLGTHNELLKFYDLFTQNLYGNYEFTNFANLQAGLAQAYSHNFANNPSTPLLAPQFSVRQYGAYAGDQWRARTNLTLTYGLRFEVPQFPTKPKANPVAVADFNMHTDVVPGPKMWSPRVGFAWDLSNGSANRQMVRGGVGSFAGRTPYVWLMNQYGNTGVDFTSISVAFNANNLVPFSADPNNQPVNVGVTGKQTINLVDPKYKYPQVLRGNLAYDRTLLMGIVGSVEYVWSKNLEDVLYKNLNEVVTGKRPDGRLTYARLDTTLNDVILLTNTKQGSTQTIAIKLDRPFKNGTSVSGSYLRNRSRAVADGAQFVALTSWRDQYVSNDINNPPLVRSNYEAGTRVNLTATIPVPLWKGLSSTIAVFYNGQTGQPYSLTYSADANGDGSGNNDMAFIPATADQVVVTNGTWDQLNAYLSTDPAAKNVRGTVPNRNPGLSPWSNDLDLRWAVNVKPNGRVKVELTMDLFNVLNALNKKWGWVMFPNFYDAQPMAYGGIDAATGKEIINIATLASQNFLGTFTRDDLRSRWQAQWGARIRF